MAYRRIHSAGGYRYEEHTAGGTITPGMLCARGSAGTVTAHGTEGGRAAHLVALEDALQGKTVADNYSSGDLVALALVDPGTEMNMLFAVGESASIGDEAVSDGAGALKNADNLASAAANKQVIGIVQEAFTTLSAAALKRVRFV